MLWISLTLTEDFKTVNSLPNILTLDNLQVTLV